MRRSIPAGLLAVAALLVAATLPAGAVTTTTIPMTDGIGPAAVDTSTKYVYVGTTPTQPADTDPWDVWSTSGGVAKVDPTTKKIIKSVVLWGEISYSYSLNITDVKVNSTTNDLWVLAGEGDVGGGCTARLYQLDKVTLGLVRSYPLGCANKIELDPTSQWAYLAEAPEYDDRGANAQPIVKAAVVSINGATGAVARATVPIPTSGLTSYGDHFIPLSIAFNRANYGLYVVGMNTAWIYTNKLNLVKVTSFHYDLEANLRAAANQTTNRVYVTDGAVVSEISGPTGNVARTATIGGGSTMVVDTASNTLYLGTNTVNLSTLTSTGKQPYKVQSVDPTTHARYFASAGTLYITK